MLSKNNVFRRSLMEDCLVAYGYCDEKLHDCIEELEKIVDEQDSIFREKHDKQFLCKFGLTNRLNRLFIFNNIFTVEDLKNYISSDPFFRLGENLRMENFGEAAFKEMCDKIPGIREHCEMVRHTKNPYNFL